MTPRCIARSQEVVPASELEVDRAHVCAIAVIVHWGEFAPTLSLAQDCLEDGSFDLVVVVANDMSTTSTSDRRIIWIVPERNLGYGTACQLAATRVKADYYAFLNPDVKLASSAAERCISALKEGVSVSGPVLFSPQGGLQSGCGVLRGVMRSPSARVMPANRIDDCQWVTGAALFCRWSVIDEVGFDGSYFLGAEDVDLCDRVREHGGRVAIVRDAVGTHQGAGTMMEGRWQYYVLRNRVWLARKRCSLIVALSAYLWLALALLPRILLADLIKRRSYDLSYSAYRALLDAGASLPPFNEPWSHEPVPQRWMRW